MATNPSAPDGDADTVDADPVSDSTEATDRLIARLDLFDQRPEARSLRARIRELLAPAHGDAVVDVGCGSGLAVAELADAGAAAVGIDPDPRMLSHARARRPDLDLREAGAYDLPFPDGALNGYRAEKVYHVLDDTPRALAEAHRVLAPGGRLVLAGQDWDAYIVDSDHPDTTRAIVRATADGLPAPRAPRSERALLLDAGFERVRVEGRVLTFTDDEVLGMLLGMARAAVTAGAVGEERAEEWTADQRDRAQRGRLFVAIPFFLVSAVKAE
ncbi:methyltransferase domain-containing protein [Nocardiopsis sp. EMB25]|uniref:methyltransferase domain-containing protein n=1 Tax=Nocardiopsis TaxID=2013 RepID=UPI000379008B|nr:MULTISPECIES: methyltransferase domain-containing protein [Nocardiopsis]MCY9784084.1 methyltransferase domain-containing protein [Nocardiopsis sp. EMB25]